MGLGCFGVLELRPSLPLEIVGGGGRGFGAAPTAEVLEHVPCLTGLPHFQVPRLVGAGAHGIVSPHSHSTGGPLIAAIYPLQHCFSHRGAGVPHDKPCYY